MADNQRFLNLCSEANTKVDEAERRFSAWLSSIAIAYGAAWNRHTSFLREASQFVQIANDIGVNAALAFFPGGVGGIVGDTMRALEAGAAVVDGLKDLAKWGLRSGAVIGMTPGSLSVGAPAELRAFPPDPSEWQNSVNVRVQTELAIATSYIGMWQNAVNNNDPQFEVSFDPMEAINRALTIEHPALDELAAAAVMIAQWNQAAFRSSPEIASKAIATAGSMAPMACSAGDVIELTSLRPVSKPDWQAQFGRGFILTWINTQAYAATGKMNQIASGGFANRLDAYGERLSLPKLGAYMVNVVNRKTAEANTKIRSIFDLRMPALR
jgi:hypothetical protein